MLPVCHPGVLFHLKVMVWHFFLPIAWTGGFPTSEMLQREIAAWIETQNETAIRAILQFITGDARMLQD